MVLTDKSLSGYTNFGTRGHMQMNYSLNNFDFDYYLRSVGGWVRVYTLSLIHI